MARTISRVPYAIPPSAISHMLFAICSRQLELFLNFLLTRPADSYRHLPFARHPEIRFGLVEAIFGVFGLGFGKRHARHRHRVLERHLSVGDGFAALVGNLKPQSIVTRLGLLRLGR